jgi:hypothetical protein
VLLYAPRGPFYSPKAARSHWRPTWKAKLAFGRVVHRTVRCTRQSGAPPDSHCSYPVRDLLPFLVHLTVGPRGRLAHWTVSGAHRTIRCAQPTVAVGHASLADHAADRWLTGQSGVPPDGPVNYSRTPLLFPENSQFTVGQPGAPDSLVLDAHNQLFPFSSLLL